MILKNVIYEDFVNYKKPSMFLIFPTCDFKCCREAGQDVCQNMGIINSPDLEISVDNLIQKYLENPISKSVVCGGLEPLDSLEELYYFIDRFRNVCSDDIVIYTGYNKDEIPTIIQYLSRYRNIIIKFGRFVPGQLTHYDQVLGVHLSSDNQFAERLS